MNCNFRTLDCAALDQSSRKLVDNTSLFVLTTVKSIQIPYTKFPIKQLITHEFLQKWTFQKQPEVMNWMTKRSGKKTVRDLEQIWAEK